MTTTTNTNTPIVDSDGNRYELTGEYRPAKEGEKYLNAMGFPLTQGMETKLSNLFSAPILRRVEPPAPFPVRYDCTVRGGTDWLEVDDVGPGGLEITARDTLSRMPGRGTAGVSDANLRDLHARLGRYLENLGGDSSE